MTIRQDFIDDFASSAFSEVAGDPAIVGKWGSIVQLDDGTYDCWAHGERVTGRRLAQIQRNVPEKWGFTILTGEGYTQGRGREFVLGMAPLIGVKRKRRMSPESRRKATARLQSARVSKNRAEQAGKSEQTA